MYVTFRNASVLELCVDSNLNCNKLYHLITSYNDILLISGNMEKELSISTHYYDLFFLSLIMAVVWHLTVVRHLLSSPVHSTLLYSVSKGRRMLVMLFSAVLPY